MAADHQNQKRIYRKKHQHDPYSLHLHGQECGEITPSEVGSQPGLEIKEENASKRREWSTVSKAAEQNIREGLKNVH